MAAITIWAVGRKTCVLHIDEDLRRYELQLNDGDAVLARRSVTANEAVRVAKAWRKQYAAGETAAHAA